MGNLGLGKSVPIGFYNQEYNQSYYVSGGAGDISGTSVHLFQVQFPTQYIRILCGNYTVVAGSGESVSPNQLHMAVTLQETADVGTPVSFTYNGFGDVYCAQNSTIWSDWLKTTAVIPAGRTIAVRTHLIVTSGQSWPTGPVTFSNEANCSLVGTAGNNYVQNSGNGSNQSLTAGAASLWTSPSVTYSYGPLSVECIPLDGTPKPVGFIAGDSISIGTGDSEATGGHCVRGLVQLGIPFYQGGKGADTVSHSQYTQGMSGYFQRMFRIQNSTFILYEFGTNDIFAGTSFSVLRGNTLVFWRQLSAYGQPIFPTTLVPRGTFSGSIYPVSNQTRNANWAQAQLYNAWLRAPKGSGVGVSWIDDCEFYNIPYGQVIDVASYIETDSSNTTPGGPSNPNKNGYWWCGPSNNTAYSSDSIHPNYAGTQLMLPAYTPAYSAMASTAFLRPYGSASKALGQ